MISVHDRGRPAPVRDYVAPGLLRVIGADRDLARIVAEATGDVIDVVTRPFVTVGFGMGGDRFFVVVLHSMDEGSRLMLSASATFVPWAPAIPRTIADVAFRQLGASELVMRAYATDVERAVVASRFGFDLIDFDGHDVTLRLGRDTLRPALRRRLLRHMH